MPAYVRDGTEAAKAAPAVDGRPAIGERKGRAERWGTMKAKATIGIVTAALLLGLAGGSQAQTPDWDRVVRPLPRQKAPQQRAPTRIIVRPVLRNRHDATEFPRTDTLGFPGRNAVRQCLSWLATEHRPSGTVVTPQMRCWWQRG